MNKMLEIKTFPIGQLQCNFSVIYEPLSRDAIFIDPGHDAKAALEIREKNNFNVKLYLHTHAHIDHIGQTHLLRKLFAAPIWLHRGDKELFEALPTQASWLGSGDTNFGAVDYFFEEHEEIGLNEQFPNVLKVIHTPGHTQGGCCFLLNEEYFGKKLLVSGDTLFANSIGRTDLPGGNYEQLLTSIKTKLFTLDESIEVIPGHGPNTSIGHEKRYNPWVQ